MASLHWRRSNDTRTPASLSFRWAQVLMVIWLSEAMVFWWLSHSTDQMIGLIWRHYEHSWLVRLRESHTIAVYGVRLIHLPDGILIKRCPDQPMTVLGAVSFHLLIPSFPLTGLCCSSEPRPRMHRDADWRWKYYGLRDHTPWPKPYVCFEARPVRNSAPTIQYIKLVHFDAIKIHHMKADAAKKSVWQVTRFDLSEPTMRTVV